MLDDNASEFHCEITKILHSSSWSCSVTPTDLVQLLGRETIPLQNYDIYAFGKKSGDSNTMFCTKMRILHRAQPRNMIQGFIGVRFLAGYGFKKVANNSTTKIMRPTDIQKLVTQDSVSFKKRAFVYIDEKHIFPLTMVESLCQIPLMEEALIIKIDKKANARKREAYARKRAHCQDWAHTNRTSVVNENHARLHRMLLTYKANLSKDDYFREFVKDVAQNCVRLKNDFQVNMNDIDDAMVSLTRMSYDNKSKENETSPKKQKIFGAKNAMLKRINVTEIGW